MKQTVPEHQIDLSRGEIGFRWVLWGLYGVALLSLVGYATFGRHPHWLSVFPDALQQGLTRFYSISFRVFGEGQTWLMVLALLAYMTWKVGGRWLAAGVVVYGVSLASEMAGTLYGVPFGHYTYSDTLMGYRLWGHVPVVIPASWFMMAVPSFALAHAAYPQQRERVIILGALLLTLWDVSLDPAMSFLVPYWSWAQKGAFYGMPLQNWLGWYITSVALMAVMAALRSERWIASLSVDWLRGFYLLNLLVPFGMLLVAGLWLGVVVNVLAFAVCLGWLLPPQMRLHRWFQPALSPVQTVASSANPFSQ